MYKTRIPVLYKYNIIRNVYILLWPPNAFKYYCKYCYHSNLGCVILGLNN